MKYSILSVIPVTVLCRQRIVLVSFFFSALRYLYCFSIYRNWKKFTALPGKGQDSRIKALRGIHGIRWGTYQLHSIRFAFFRFVGADGVVTEQLVAALRVPVLIPALNNILMTYRSKSSYLYMLVLLNVNAITTDTGRYFECHEIFYENRVLQW